MNIDELEREYRDLHRPLYEGLAAKIAELIQVLTEESGISTAQIEFRAKTVASFLGKVQRKSYKEPFDEIKDFAGIRIITYYNDDVPRISELIHAEFVVDESNSTDKFMELDVDEFGYRSFHLVCKLGAARNL